jgi:hypothetical protein
VAPNARASADGCLASVTVAQAMKTVLTAAKTSSMTMMVVVTWLIRSTRRLCTAAVYRLVQLPPGDIGSVLAIMVQGASEDDQSSPSLVGDATGPAAVRGSGR